MIKASVWIKENGQEIRIIKEISEEDIKDLVRKKVIETECSEDAILEITLDSFYNT